MASEHSTSLVDRDTQPWGIEVAELPASFARIRGVTKTLILFFYPFIARYSQEEENRQLEKLHSALRLRLQLIFPVPEAVGLICKALL